MASLFIDTASQQGFGYKSVQSMDPSALLQHRQPLRWWQDGTAGTANARTYTASLRSVSNTPLADLREVKRHLQFKSISLLVSGSAESPVLYVHSVNPIREVLDPSCLENLRLQRQHVLFFMLKPPYNVANIQDAFNCWVTQRSGFNAAVVHSPSDMLVLFSDETIAEPVPECFRVSLAFCGNVCPLVDVQTTDNITLWVSGNWASIEELNVITRALVAIQEPGITRIEVDEGWSQLRIRLRSTDDIIRVREATTNTLRSWGRRCALKCNKIVLYQCAIPLSPFESEIDLSAASQSVPPPLRATIAATDAALGERSQDMNGDIFAYDATMHLLSQLNCDAILRHNYLHSFDIHGMKCIDCVQAILEELFLDRPGRVGYTHIALSPTRNVLSVNVPAEQRHAVQQHVQDSLSALGMSATMIGQGPDLEPVDDPQAQALYTIWNKKRPARTRPATSAVAIRLRPEGLRCSSCAELLRSTLMRVLPGIAHVALDCESATMVVHYSGSEVTEAEILTMLDNVGYQPKSFTVPFSAAMQQQSVPVSPVSSTSSKSSTQQYFNGGTVGPALRNGQLNPYAMAQPIEQPQKPYPHPIPLPSTPTSRMSRGYANTTADTHNNGGNVPRGYPEVAHPLPSNVGKKHVAVVPWKTAPPQAHVKPGLLLDKDTEITEDGRTVLVFNNNNNNNTGNNDGQEYPAQAGEQLSISVPMRLRHRYTVWYDNVRTRVQLQQSGEADYTLTEVASFETMPEFWQIWEHLDIESLDEGSILIVFRSDIPPDHNHVANRCGGRWFVRGVSVEPRTKLWTKLVLAMLSDCLVGNSDYEVCGVVLSVKPSGDRIEIWVDGGYHQGDEQLTHDRESGRYLPNILTSLLGDELGHRRFHFWTHAGFERHRKSHRGSVRRAKRHSKLSESRSNTEEGSEAASF